MVDDQEYLALIDSGAQLTQMSLSLAKKLKLHIHALDTIIEAESTGGGRVAYLGYVEARLKIPGIKGMDHDSLFMVVNDSPYTERVPITIGTLHIKQALKVVTPTEFTKLPEAWGIANFPPITKQSVIKEPSFDLDTAKGKIKLTKTIEIGPFETICVPGKTTFKKHFKRLNIMVESLIEPNCNTVVPVRTYTILKPGSTRLNVGLGNLSGKAITVHAKMAITQFTAANAIPETLAPHVTDDKENEQKTKKLTLLSTEKQDELFKKVDLTGTQEWSAEQKEEVRQLFIEYRGLFALDSMDLGKTSQVKHKICLNDYTPFKERYCRIPPHLYEEVK